MAPYLGARSTAETPEMHVVPDPLDGPVYGGNLLVLPGNSRIFDHDASLAKVDYRDFSSINQLGGFGALCDALEAHYDLDYIIVDLSPGASALNKIIVLRCAWGARGSALLRSCLDSQRQSGLSISGSLPTSLLMHTFPPPQLRLSAAARRHRLLLTQLDKNHAQRGAAQVAEVAR